MTSLAKQSPTTVAAIQTCGLGKVFGEGRQRVVALDDVSIELCSGQMTLLMGPSGSGKSSMIAALGGLQAPDTGQVIALGEDLWSRSSRKITRFRRDHCGFVFQSGGLFPALGARDQIALPLTFLGWSAAEAKRSACEALDWVGLADRQDSRPSEMSGGQNQRIAIARMLAKKPTLIFCDEPTSALDGKNGANIAELLKQAAARHNAMILCVTHDERLVPHADRILHIEDGRITSDSEEDKPYAANR